MIIELLTEKGFVENLDFIYVDGALITLERFNTITTYVEHEAIPEILDDNDVVIQAAVEAWTETIETQESYFPTLPLIESLKKELIIRHDAALVIQEYLKDKVIGESDSLNIDLFLDGGEGWHFENIPAPTIAELYESVANAAAAKATFDFINSKVLVGIANAEACKKVIAFIGGYNESRSLTVEQINSMRLTFETIKECLHDGMPKTAKILISAVEIDSITTQELKDGCLELLKEC